MSNPWGSALTDMGQRLTAAFERDPALARTPQGLEAIDNYSKSVRYAGAVHHVIGYLEMHPRFQGKVNFSAANNYGLNGELQEILASEIRAGRDARWSQMIKDDAEEILRPHRDAGAPSNGNNLLPGGRQ